MQVDGPIRERCWMEWKCFSQLLDDPQTCRMLCDIEVQDTPTVVTDDEQTIEHAEGDRRNSEEVHRGNRFRVITEKGKPVLGPLRISRCPFHPTRDRGRLPTGLLTLEISLQYKRNPPLCQRTTVSGVTAMRDCSHPDQNRRTATQKSLSSRFSLGRGCRRFRTASCCRSARFSRTRFRRLRKRRMSAPTQRLNMPRSYNRSTVGEMAVTY